MLMTPPFATSCPFEWNWELTKLTVLLIAIINPPFEPASLFKQSELMMDAELASTWKAPPLIPQRLF